MVADTNGHGSKLAAALILAKKKFKPLVKNKVNPYFKSRYADLEAVHDAVDDALMENGLSVTQPMGFDENDHFCIATELTHAPSGEVKVSRWPLPGGAEPQKLAAAVTYGRRVTLCALLGIPAEDDDDGEATEGRSHPREVAPQKKEEPPKKETKKDPAWVGTVASIESIKSGLWKVTGGDTSTFATSNADHRAFAEAASKSLINVEITYRLNSVGSKIIETIKESKK